MEPADGVPRIFPDVVVHQTEKAEWIVLSYEGAVIGGVERGLVGHADPMVCSSLVHTPAASFKTRSLTRRRAKRSHWRSIDQICSTMIPLRHHAPWDRPRVR